MGKDKQKESSIKVRELMDVLKNVDPEREVFGCWEGKMEPVWDIEDNKDEILIGVDFPYFHKEDVGKEVEDHNGYHKVLYVK